MGLNISFSVLRYTQFTDALSTRHKVEYLSFSVPSVSGASKFYMQIISSASIELASGWTDAISNFSENSG
jgi:hypothetical protein